MNWCHTVNYTSCRAVPKTFRKLKARDDFFLCRFPFLQLPFTLAKTVVNYHVLARGFKAFQKQTLVGLYRDGYVLEWVYTFPEFFEKGKSGMIGGQRVFYILRNRVPISLKNWTQRTEHCMLKNNGHLPCLYLWKSPGDTLPQARTSRLQPILNILW